jgi:hypothetical protein
MLGAEPLLELMPRIDGTPFHVPDKGIIVYMHFEPDGAILFSLKRC